MRPTAATAPAKPRPIHSFKPGRHTTMAGEVIEFTAADLAATAAAYNPQLSRAPIVKGHPATDSPAQGWISGIEARANGLFAKPDQVDPAFAEEVRAGRWGAVSLKFYRPTDRNNPVPGVWYPKHLGFLGGQNPAVKGLEPPEFAEQADDGCVCFAEPVAFSGWDDLTVAGLFRNLREFLIAKFSAAEADQVVPQYQVQQLEASAQRDLVSEADGQAAAFAEAPPAAAAATPPTSTPPNPQEPAVTEAEAQQLRDQLAAAERERDELRQRASAAAQQAAQAEAVAFSEQLATERRIPADDKPLLAAVALQLQQAAPDVQFGEGTAAKPLHQAWRDWMAQRPPLAGTGEQATRERAAVIDTGDVGDDVQFAEGEVDADRLALDQRIHAHAKQHGTSYAQAANAVMRSTR